MIHRYWTGPDEPTIAGPVGRVWRDDDLPVALVAYLDACAGQVQPADRLRHRSNMVRWWLLATHGGMWLDHDATLLADPPPPPFVGYAGRLTCAVMALPPRHPLTFAMLDHISRQPESDRSCTQVSGDSVLNAIHPIRFGVRFQPIAMFPFWVEHRWVTSRARATR